MNSFEKHFSKPSAKFIKEREDLISFISQMEIVYAYSPDHEPGGLYQRALRKAKQIRGDIPKLSRKLKKKFFSKLYVDRSIRQKIYDYIIGTNNLIFISGLVGTGKTVLVRKLQIDLKHNLDIDALIINFRKERDDKKSSTGGGLDYESIIYREIYDNLLERNEVEDWNTYEILYDENFRSVRLKAERLMRHKLETLEDIAAARKNPKIEELFSSIEGSETPETLIRYLLNKGSKFVLIFDNIDRLEFRKQLQLVNLAFGYSEIFGMPMVVTIRETNLRHIIDRMREESGNYDFQGYVYYYEDLSPTSISSEGIFSLEPSHPSQVREMLTSRYGILNEDGAFKSLQKYKEKFLEDHQFTSEEYDSKFNRVLDEITYEFVDIGVYRYANFNLREMLIQYSTFVTTLLLNPEPKYRWDKLLTKSGRIDKTLLKTFMLNWQITNGEVLPSPLHKVNNIFEADPECPNLLAIYLLVYICNRMNENGGKGLYAKEIIETFQKMGVPEDKLRNKLIQLSEAKEKHELGLIWIDAYGNKQVHNDRLIVLNPAGEYFLKTLSTSREYAFWASISANGIKHIVRKRFELKDTYSDKFKLDAVANLISEVLIPQISIDFEIFLSKTVLPKNWEGSRNDYIKKYFLRDEKLYVEHLTLSVRELVKFSSGINKRVYRAKFTQLLGKVSTEITEAIRKMEAQ